MGGPITWRNIDSPNLGSPGQSLLGAQQSINGAFDAIGNVLRERRALDNSNETVLQENGRQAFLDALQAARTPEELAALQASGRLDELKSGLTPQVAASLRGSADARLLGLRQSALAEQEYGANQRAVKEAPVRDQIATLTAMGRHKEAAALLASSGISNQAPLATGITTAARNEILRAREDRRDANQTTLDGFKIESAKRTAAEEKRFDGVRTATNAGIAAYQNRVAARRQEAAPLFSEFDSQGYKDSRGNVLTLPRNTDGSVKFDAISGELKGKLDSFLANKNHLSVDEIAGSDTEARAEFVAGLRKAGATQEDLSRLDGVIGAGFNSSPQEASGNDRERLLRNQRLQDAAASEAAKNYVPLSDRAATDEVLNETASYIDKRFGADSDKAKYWRVYLDGVVRRGLVAKDDKGNVLKDGNGKMITVTPSASTLIALMNSVNTDGWRPFSMKSNDLEERINEYLKDPEIYRAAGRAVSAGMTKSIRGIDPVDTKDPKKK